MTDAVMDAWSGRDDGPGPEHARWHQLVRSAGAVDGSHIGLVGFASDEGVRRNRGRVGAAAGPTAVRRALSPLALHGALADGSVGIVDHGDVVCHGEDLEDAHARGASAISQVLDAGAEVAIVLGGGHETAWASYGGLLGSQRMQGDATGRVPRWGVLNLDAHFDLREESRPTSGTPFRQMAEAEAAAGRELHYAVAGVAEASNTGALFAAAERLGVRWLTDVECADAARVEAFVTDFVADLDVLYLTIDLDVLPAAAAPGVSAPAAFGVAMPTVAVAVRAAAASGKLALLDVVELNPDLDIDNRTARAAARLIDEAVRTISREHP